jgi:hypothetical protein
MEPKGLISEKKIPGPFNPFHGDILSTKTFFISIYIINSLCRKVQMVSLSRTGKKFSSKTIYLIHGNGKC